MALKKRSGPANQVVDLELGGLNPKQEQFFSSRKLYTAYGGARGGGKTHAVRVKAVGGAIRYPGIKILIVRRTYPELQSNHIEPIMKLVPQTLASYNGTLHTMYFVNDSIIKFGHFSGVVSEQEYMGQEYDWIFMDEATQFTEREFRFLGGLLRGVNDIPKRFYITCNPGGVGHYWVKRLFIERKFKQDSKIPEENENPDDYAPLIFATVEDNEILMKSSPQYLQMLSALPENIRRAHRYGDWDALAGNYFPEFDRKKHMVEAFRIPAHWIRYRAMDYGLDMLAVGWFAIDEGGHSYMYRELKMPNLKVSDAAHMIHSMTLPEEKIMITFAPPDLWARQKDTGKTMAELFYTSGIAIVKADNNRVQGWMQLKEALKLHKDGKPGLTFFDNCDETMADLEVIQVDDRNPNDCAKEPHDPTHATDMLRYYCVSRTMRPEDIIERELEDYDEPEAEEEYDDYMTGGEVTMSYISYGGN